MYTATTVDLLPKLDLRQTTVIKDGSVVVRYGWYSLESLLEGTYSTYRFNEPLRLAIVASAEAFLANQPLN